MNNLKEYIKENDLVLPNYNKKNIIDLVKSIYIKAGCKITNNKNIAYFSKMIPNNKNIIFILSDGTGANLINKLNNKSILKKNLKDEIVTIFPSTTGCVLTSIATASFPEEHGIWGWYTYNRKYDKDFMPLIFSDRKTNKELSEFNIFPKDIFKKESMIKKTKIKTNVLYPNFMVDSTYSKFVANDESRKGYEKIDDIVKIVKSEIKNTDKSFTYIYLPQVDSIEHKNGVDGIETMKTLKEVESLVKKLSKIKDATIILTSDHGQYNVNEDIIMDFDKYSKYFYALPTIDYGTASYYVKDKYKDKFIKEFQKDYEGKMDLFDKQEFINNKMFGKGKEANEAFSNLGEYISLCRGNSYLINNINIEGYYKKIKGNHSGLTKDEMIVPVIIIDTNKQ